MSVESDYCAHERYYSRSECAWCHEQDCQCVYCGIPLCACNPPINAHEPSPSDPGAPDSAPVGPSATENAKGSQIFDVVRRPVHYNSHPSGVECIEITEHMNYCLGNAFKYIWRADLKGRAIEDLKKAAFYIDREIERRTQLAGSD